MSSKLRSPVSHWRDCIAPDTAQQFQRALWPQIKALVNAQKLVGPCVTGWSASETMPVMVCLRIAEGSRVRFDVCRPMPGALDQLMRDIPTRIRNNMPRIFAPGAGSPEWNDSWRIPKETGEREFSGLNESLKGFTTLVFDL
ncbi:hypothetical protein AB1N83_011096 [Pleurotus pulmonarius]